MLTGGLVARRKALTKSTEYHVRPAGWISKGPSPLSETCKGLAIHGVSFRGFGPLVIHRENLGLIRYFPKGSGASFLQK